MTTQEQMLKYVNEQTDHEEKEATLDREALMISMQALATGNTVDGDEFLDNLGKELKSRNLIK